MSSTPRPPLPTTPMFNLLLGGSPPLPSTWAGTTVNAATAVELRIKLRREIVPLALLISLGEFMSRLGAYHGWLAWQPSALPVPTAERAAGTAAARTKGIFVRAIRVIRG